MDIELSKKEILEILKDEGIEEWADDYVEMQSYQDLGKKVYLEFEIGQRLIMSGMVNVGSDQYGKAMVAEVGDLVLSEIKKMYMNENTRDANGNRVRKFKYMQFSIGGPIKQKIFRYSRTVRNAIPYYEVWRVQ